jgi:hypothetical protein
MTTRKRVRPSQAGTELATFSRFRFASSLPSSQMTTLA